MGAEIRLTGELNEDERKTLFGWGENIFGVEDALLRWRPKELHFVAEDDAGRAVAHVGLVEASVRAGGRDIRVCGVGGVVSTPEGRGQGHVHAAMRLAAAHMCDELGVEFGMLFCLPRLVAFYERQGWQLVEDDVEFDQPDGRRLSPMRVMVLPCGGRQWPGGKVEITGFPW